MQFPSSENTLFANGRELSDTATPGTLVPIILLHNLEKPFCDNPRCECHTYEFLVKRLFHQVARSKLRMRRIDLQEQETQCETFGHALVTGAIPHTKVCHLCGTLAYCPGCTPERPAPSAIPLFCTAHTERSNSL